MRLFSAVCISLIVSLASLMAADQAPAVAATAQAAAPLAVGEKLPAAPGLLALDGSGTDLATVTKGKPSIIIVYRGGWCPYCNKHLAAIAKEKQTIVDAGYQIIGISPDGVKSLKGAQSKTGYDVAVYSDSQMNAIKGLGLAFAVDGKTLKKYKGYGIPLVNAPGTETPTLPVPAVFVSDAEGKITFRHYDPDFSKRLSAKDLLAAIGK